jgi:hypothetical protein
MVALHPTITQVEYVVFNVIIRTIFIVNSSEGPKDTIDLSIGEIKNKASRLT